MKTGGPAFPNYSHTESGHTFTEWEGMTLRDWFAAHAPSDLFEWFNTSQAVEKFTGIECVGEQGSLAKASTGMLKECVLRYAWADAMLLAREHVRP